MTVYYYPYSATVAAEITHVAQEALQELLAELAIGYQQASQAAYHIDPATPETQKAAAYYSRSAREFLGIEDD